MASFTPTTTAFTTSSTVATQQINQTVADPYWANVVLLCHFDGSNGSTQFIDSSSFANTISNQSTSYPAQISSTQSKFGGGALGGASAVTSYYTNVATSPCFSFGTSDFTIEFWYYWNGTYATTSGTQQALICNTTAAITTNNWYIWFSNTSGNGTACMQFYVNAVAGYACTTPITTGWAHYAFTRTNGNIYAFYNGQLQSTTTITSTQGIDAGSPTSYPIIIGGIPGSSYYQNGWIDELRITNGICRYSSTFTPLTQPYPSVNVGYVQDPNLSQVSLLLHFDNGVTDASQNALAVNTAGSAVISAGNSGVSGSAIYFPSTGNYNSLSYTASNLALTSFNPLDTISAGANAMFSFNKLTSSYTGPVANLAIQFKNSSNADIYADRYGNLTVIDTSLGASSNVSITNNDPYYASVALLVHNTVTDSSKYAATLTTTGTVTVSSAITNQFKSPTSLYFPTGNGNYALTPSSANYTIGTNNFTVECWVYPTSTNSIILVGNFISTGWQANEWGLLFNGTQFQFAVYGMTTIQSTTISLNTWYHVAGVRSGNTFSLYVNGVSVGTPSTWTTAVDSGTSNLISIGGTTSAYGSVNGYLQDVRVTIGVARYTANFSLPVAPFPNFNLGTFAYTGFAYPQVNTLYDQSGNANHAYQTSQYIQATLDPYNKLIDFRANYGLPYMLMPPGTIPANSVGNTVTFKSGATTYAQQNLIGYWDFTKVSSYAGYGATTVTDLSGNGNNLTWYTVNSAYNTFTATVPSYTTYGYGALVTNNGTQAAVINTTLDLSRGWTCECLFSMPAASGNTGLVFFGTDNQAFSLVDYVSSGSRQIAILAPGGWVNSSGFTTVANTWYHVVATLTPTGVGTIYINGIANITFTSATVVSATPLTGYLGIGYNPDVNAGNTTTLTNYALARVYGTALSSAQVWANYCSAYNTGKFKAKFPSYVTTSLVGYWDFSTYASYPGSGTTLYDLSGNAYNATITQGNGTGYNSIGALCYNTGTTTVFTNSSFYPINFSSGITIETLIYFTVSNQNYLYISLTPTYTIQIFISSNQTIYIQPINNGSVLTAIQTTSAYSLNSWLHIIISSTSSTAVIYINGVSVSLQTSGIISGLSASATTAGTIYLANYSSGSNGFAGKFAMARIYNTALTAAQVQQNYTSVFNKFPGNPYGIPPPPQAALAWPSALITANTMTLTGKAYGNGTYVVTASSSSDGFQYNAFNNSWWFSAAAKYPATTGAISVCSSGANLGGKIGEWLVIQLPVPIILTAYYFHSGGNGTYAWWMLGSNDNLSWYTVDDRSSGTSAVNSDADGPTFSVISSQPYQYFGIVINSIKPSNGSNQSTANLMKYALYGIPQTPLALYNMPFPLPTAPYVTTNLIGYWDFGLSASYPGSGNTVYDLSGNGLNLVYNTPPTFYSIGNANSIINTASQYASVLTTVYPSYAVFEVLVYFTALNATNYIMMYCNNGDGTGYIGLYVNSTGQVGILSGGTTSGTYLSSAGVITTGVWYHIIGNASSISSTTAYVCVNGLYYLLSGGTSAGYGLALRPLIIGNFSAISPANGMVGRIAFARFYSFPVTGAMTSAQVAINYQNAINRIPGNPYNLPAVTSVATYVATTVPYTTTSLLAYWDFNKPASYAGYGATTVTDLSGNNLNLTWNTAPTYTTTGYGGITLPAATYGQVAYTQTFSTTGFTFESLYAMTTIYSSGAASLLSVTNNGSPSWNSTFLAYTTSGWFITNNNNGTNQNSSVVTNPVAIVNTYYHVVYTVTSGGAYNIYINGTLILSGTGFLFPASVTPSYLVIGTYLNSAGYGQPANVALARVYTTPLSAAQVWANYGSAYNSGRFQVKTPTYVTTGLVGYWDFSTYASYPNGGTILYDLSGNSYNLTFAGGMIASNFVNTGAMAMNANATSIAYASTLTSVTTANGFTFEFLVKPTLGTAMVMGSLYSGIICGIAATNGQVTVINQGSTSYSQTTGGNFVSYGIWNHIVISMPSSGVATSFVFYVNNVVATNQGSALANFTFPSSGTFNLGNTTSTSTTGGLNGQIAMMRFYNTQLTATQVAQNYASVYNKLSGNPYGLPPPGESGLSFPPTLNFGTGSTTNQSYVTVISQNYGNGIYICNGTTNGGTARYPQSAFNTGSNSWFSQANYGFSTSASTTPYPYMYSGANSLGGILGEGVYLTLPTPIIPTFVSFNGGGQGTGTGGYCVGIFYVLGSNDYGSTWTTLTTTPLSTNYGTITLFSIPATNISYSTLAVLAVAGSGATFNPSVSIGNLKFYGSPATSLSLYNMPYYTTGAPYTTTNLVEYIDFGLIPSYSGSGLSVYDLSGNGYNMKMNTSTFTYNSSGAISLTFASGIVATTISQLTMNHATGFTYEFMIYTTSLAAQQIILSYYNTGSGNAMYIVINTTGTIQLSSPGYGGATAVTTSTISINTWYHIVLSYTSTSSIAIYINGVASTVTISGTFTPPTATATTFNLGNLGTDQTGYALVGKYAFARIYNTPLTSAQVSTNYLNAINRISSNPYLLPGYQYPPVAFTSSATLITGGTYYSQTLTSTYGTGIYYAKASSSIVSSGNGDTAWNAFDKSSAYSAPTQWYSAVGLYSVSGLYIGTASLNGIFGEWIMLQLPYAITLTNYQIIGDVITDTGSPYSWNLLGSNDGTTWTILDTKINTNTASGSALFAVSVSIKYSYFAIITTVNSGAVRSYGGTTSALCIEEVYYYGY